MVIRVYERSPFNCAHPTNRHEGAKCGKCGSRVAPVKPFLPATFEPTPYTAEDAAYDVMIEREALAERR